MERLLAYLRDTRVELTRVAWPSPRQAAVYTVLVIGVSIFVSALLGVFDAFLTYALDYALGV